MQVVETNLPGIIVFEPDVFGDHRGWFIETFNAERYKEAGLEAEFVQDNVSFSSRGILRGLHFQNPVSQGKLVQVLDGEVFDVAVDIRKGSPDFGKWHGEVLSVENHKQMFIPEGFAHGFCVLSETAIFSYKCTDYYSPSTEGGVIWNDPDIGIDWPVKEPVLSQKDTVYSKLSDISVDVLPKYEVTK